MSLLDQLATIPRAVGGSTCGIAVACAQHPDLADDILEIVESDVGRQYPASMIVTLLADHGVSVARTSVTRHRRGDCLCHR